MSRWATLQESINWLILVTFILHVFFAFYSVNRGRPSNVVKVGK